MKFLMSFLLIISAFSAFASTEELICHSEGKVVLFASIEVNSLENFKVSLTSENGEAIPVWSQWITLDAKGDLQSVRTSGGWENFQIEKSSDGKWTGEYWYDNYPYYLSCQSK